MHFDGSGWMGPERYALLAGCDYTLLPSRHRLAGVLGGFDAFMALSGLHTAVSSL